LSSGSRLAQERAANIFAADALDSSDRFTLMPIAYSTPLVTAADAPKSFHRPARSEMAGKIVKAYPGYAQRRLSPSGRGKSMIRMASCRTACRHSPRAK